MEHSALTEVKFKFFRDTLMKYLNFKETSKYANIHSALKCNLEIRS